MFTFNGCNEINLRQVTDDQFILTFVLGLIKNYIDDRECKNEKIEGRYKVIYQNGGAGPNFVEVYDELNPKAPFIFGFAGTVLGCDIYENCETGDMKDGDSLDKEVVMINEINQFIKKMIDKLID